MRVLVTGATGYIGGRLVPDLVAAGHTVRCVAREPARLEGRFEDVEIVRGDVFDEQAIRAALADVEAAYYLVHSMSDDRRDFTSSDRLAAERLGGAARAAGVRRIIFLGGLGVDDDAGLSSPLKPSRGRRLLALRRRPGDRIPRRDHRRLGQCVVRDDIGT